jgi:hypothetical protein
MDWKLKIPIPLAVKFDLYYADNLTGEMQRGVRSNVMTELIRNHLREKGVDVD